jgi:hypothetical protein
MGKKLRRLREQEATSNSRNKAMRLSGLIAKAKKTQIRNTRDLEKLLSEESVKNLTKEEFEKLTLVSLERKAKCSKSKGELIGRQQYNWMKACEKCQNIHFDEKLLLCDICDDAYHTFCLVSAF